MVKGTKKNQIESNKKLRNDKITQNIKKRFSVITLPKKVR